MQRKIDKKKVYNAGRGKSNEEFIHLHMSNHYRRILNAKKAIDNSPPYCFKLKRPSSGKPLAVKAKVNPTFENLALTDRSLSTNSNKESCWGTESYGGSSRYHSQCIPPQPTHEPNIKHIYSNVDLINRITYDTKKGPTAYCEDGWMEVKAEFNNKRYATSFEIHRRTDGVKISPSAKRRIPNTAANQTAQKRKFADQSKPEISAAAQIPLEASNCKCSKICVCDTNEAVLKKISINPKEQSVTSSRDSAYNGGVSSLPESRSPTPDHRIKKECCCCCCEKKQREGKHSESAKPPGSRIESPRPPVPASVPSASKSKNQLQGSFEKMHEDAMYVKFIQDITTEILEKNLYTNKALKKIMKKHVKNNIETLHKDRMLKEVENLRIQLGIPEDKSLLDLEDAERGGSWEGGIPYPIISDSEFVLPKNVAVHDEKKSSTGSPTAKKISNNIGDALPVRRENEKVDSVTETDNEEAISVIQMMSLVPENRKVKDVDKGIDRQNLSEDSDRPSDPKKRSVSKNRKQKYLRNYLSSSSDSEISEKFSRKVGEKTEFEVSGSSETYLGDFAQKSTFLTKKSRSVSFWKNPDLNLIQTIEMRDKKTVTRGKDAIARNKRKDG